MRGGSVWSFALIVTVLLVPVASGVFAIVRPDRFTGGLLKGGEMLTDWQRLSAQLGGLTVAVASGYMLYSFLADALSH